MTMQADSHALARRELVAEIEAEAAELSAEVREAIAWPGVLEALSRVPREKFVDAVDEVVAYRNVPLPIGHGQTISQPFIVALMTGALNPEPGHRVLEIGTGSGYQAAVLARLVSDVYSVEIVAELAARAKNVLAGTWHWQRACARATGTRGGPRLDRSMESSLRRRQTMCRTHWWIS